MREYTDLSAYYDGLNDGCPYAAYADFIAASSERFGVRGKAFVDFACGTGTLSVLMAEKGYAVTAFDLSESELTVAENKARNAGVRATFLHGDMRYFATAGRFALGAATMDSVNYLLTGADVAAFLRSAYDCLERGGVFVFDVNTRWRFEHLYADNAYILESDEAFLAWQNEYNEKTRRCKFYLTLFVPHGRAYERYDEIHTEKCHLPRTLEKLVGEAGFELCGVFGDLSFGALAPESEKAYYVLRKP